MNIDNLKNAIIDQAKYFLDHAGEFYPFGGVINNKDEIVPLAAATGDEHPQSQEVIDLLEKAIIEKLKNGEAKIAGICIDVTYKPRGENYKKSAIQIKMLQSDGASIDYYLPYNNIEDHIEYEELFDDIGTFKLS
jgi:hypothetical protein